MHNKGRVFTGHKGGAHYKRWATLFGFHAAYYRRAVGNIRLEGDMKALDLGCGPGGLCFALAENAPPAAEIYDLDLGEEQLTYARQHAGTYPCTLMFQQGSMDELPFPGPGIFLVFRVLEVFPSTTRNRLTTTVFCLSLCHVVPPFLGADTPHADGGGCVPLGGNDGELGTKRQEIIHRASSYFF